MTPIRHGVVDESSFVSLEMAATITGLSLGIIVIGTSNGPEMPSGQPIFPSVWRDGQILVHLGAVLGVAKALADINAWEYFDNSEPEGVAPW